MNPNDPTNQYPNTPNPVPVSPSGGIPTQQFAPPQNMQQPEYGTSPTPVPPLQSPQSPAPSPQYQQYQPPIPEQQPPSPAATVPHPMVVMQPGEQIVCRIKRHPFGIVSSYIGGGAVVLLAAAAAIFLVPRLTEQSSNSSQIQLFAYGLVGLVAIAAAAILSVISKVYWQNEWIVTDDSVTQLSQMSLFSRQSSQLSMDNLEDVTVDQHGMLEQMFNFGTLRVETAGERSKFVFPYCPDPTKYARLILEAREASVRSRLNRS